MLNSVSYFFFLVFFIETGMTLLIEVLEHKHSQRLLSTLIQGSDRLEERDAEAKALARRTLQCRVNIVRKVTQDVAFLVLILSGAIVVWLDLCKTLQLPFPVEAALYFLGLWLLFYMLELGIACYRERMLMPSYGISREKSGSILKDWFKGGLSWVAVIIGLTIPTVWVICTFPDFWWAVGWLVAIPVQFYLTVLCPAIVEPLALKLESLEDSPVTKKIKRLAEQRRLANITIHRMRRTNSLPLPGAFCVGLGPGRRIVLPDAVMEALSPEEILAIVAHEFGHLKSRHILLSFLLGCTVSMLVLYLSFLILNWTAFYEAFNFEAAALLPSLFVVGVFWRKVGSLARPLYVCLLRTFETQADAYAAQAMGRGKPLAEGLRKSAILQGNDFPRHPLYALFHVTHPTLDKRVTLMNNADNNSPVT